MEDELPVRWKEAYRTRLVNRLASYATFIQKLETDDTFERKLFLEFRSATMSQSEWASLIGVAQGTIGNWERGVTYPSGNHRKLILVAAKQVLDRQQAHWDQIAQQLGIKFRVDVAGTKSQLDSSILRAAWTDFAFDAETKTIIPIPFKSDSALSDIEEIVRDRHNLLESLAVQTSIIIDGVTSGANVETDRFVKYLREYADQCRKSLPNPRLLHRLGTTIAGRTSDDEFRYAINGWDDQAIDGFNADHVELMRLYYREALARAQEVESTELQEDGFGENPSESFLKVAELLVSAKNSDGSQVFSDDIPTLLRDVAREVRDFDESAMLTYDDRRREILKRRRRDAIKSGSIYIGRILFFSSLFIALTPGAAAYAGSIASVLGFMDQLAPGTVRSVYDRIRSAFPILPKLDLKETGDVKSKGK